MQLEIEDSENLLLESGMETIEEIKTRIKKNNVNN